MIMDNIDSIESLLNTKISWTKEPGHPRWIAYYGGEKCELLLGDFPVEPLYTLIWRDQNIAFDDTPPKWNLPQQ